MKILVNCYLSKRLIKLWGVHFKSDFKLQKNLVGVLTHLYTLNWKGSDQIIAQLIPFTIKKPHLFPK
jgi:hypothetical protein